ncbi:MAG: ATP-binding protein [Clostridia bacterium]|nr:ATP-binding protein [Clostridia bacterium]
MKIEREIKTQIAQDLITSGKVIIVYGPRQAGKTTLSNEIIAQAGLKTLKINADQIKYIDVLSSRDLTKLKMLVSGYELLFIDEGQRVPEIGLNLKILHDEIPELKILVTGSSSFLLSERITEPLTGRKIVFTLLPISMKELSGQFNAFELMDQLEKLLIYGQYPEVITYENLRQKEDYLREISESLMYKDILELENIKFPMKIRELLQLLAYQIGSQVSINELCQKLGLNRQTVERYLHLLQQSLIIFRLNAFSTNQRNEISKSQKFYFYDTGIRNVLIDNFKTLILRNDVGALWENFVIAERRKKVLYERRYVESYFWRTYHGVELDYIEKKGEQLSAFEIKYSKAKLEPPKSWVEHYGNNYQCITRDNFLEFVL